jgi:hypothetical protein
MEGQLAREGAETAGPVRSRLNPVFQHEQRAQTVVDDTEATELAGRVTGEIASEADQDRLEVEKLVQEVEGSAPGTAKALDAEAAAAEAEKDADEAVSMSLDSDAAAEDARRAEGTHYLHRSADPDETTADRSRSLKDEARAAADLSALDALKQRVEGDRS